jgi:ankyrin repeat protein
MAAKSSNSRDKRACHWACRYGRSEVVALLLGFHRRCGGPQLRRRRTMQRLMTRQMLSYATLIMAQALTLQDVEEAVQQGNASLVVSGLAQTGTAVLDIGGVKDSWFVTACANGHTDVTAVLLDLKGARRVNVHAGYYEALHRACCNGHTAIVKLLTGLTGDRWIDVFVDCEHGFTGACQAGHIGVVQALLDARPTCMCIPESLHGGFLLACSSGRTTILTLMLGMRGAWAINVHAQNGRALVQACCGGCADTVALLLQLQGDRRVNVHRNESEGFRAACVFQWPHRSHVDTVKLFLGLGGDRAIDVSAVSAWVFQRKHVRPSVLALLLAYRGLTGAPAVATLRRGGEWGYIVEKERWRALAARPRWLAAARRSAAMAARAVRRRRSCGAGAQCSG